MGNTDSGVTLDKIKDRFDVIISLLARQVLDPQKVKESITKGAKNKDRIVKCFNLCDGKTTLTDIAKIAKIDQGGLSRQINSWEKEGYIYKIKEVQNVYPKALIYIP